MPTIRSWYAPCYDGTAKCYATTAGFAKSAGRRSPWPAKAAEARPRSLPLALVLLLVEATDVAFAVDSIPAIFGVTQDPFIVYTSNVCAILGLRSLYFLLAGSVRKFVYLNRNPLLPDARPAPGALCSRSPAPS
jgi:predicted tellurium resistance membrane protein TerC